MYGRSKAELLASLDGLMGGRVAEELQFGKDQVAITNKSENQLYLFQKNCCDCNLRICLLHISHEYKQFVNKLQARRFQTYLARLSAN